MFLAKDLGKKHLNLICIQKNLQEVAVTQLFRGLEHQHLDRYYTGD